MIIRMEFHESLMMQGASLKMPWKIYKMCSLKIGILDCVRVFLLKRASQPIQYRNEGGEASTF